MDLRTLFVHSNNLRSLKHLPSNIIHYCFEENPIFLFYEHPVGYHEVSGTSKFLKLKDERKNLLSYVGLLKEENLYKLYVFF